MLARHIRPAVAGCALTLAAAVASVARADDRPFYLDDAPPKPDKPLAGMLKHAGFSTGDISIYGFVEGSYTYSASAPPGNFITGRVFDVDHEDPTLNQLDLSIEKTVDAAALAKENK